MFYKTSKITVQLDTEIESKLINQGFNSPPITFVQIVKSGRIYEVQIDQATHGISFNKKAIDKFNGYFNTGYKKSTFKIGHKGSYMSLKFKTLKLAQFVFDECEMWTKDAEYYSEI